MAAVKFARAEEWPKGFLYRKEFLSIGEESDLLWIFRGLKFTAYDYHGYQAKRRIVRYGVNYDINTRAQRENLAAIPEFLIELRARAAEFAGVAAEDLAQAMISEYSVGTPIGWHRDAPQFGTIVGISLGSACRFRLKPYPSAGETASNKFPSKMLSLRLEARSIYVMEGAARSDWQHSIPAVDRLRYSITFRTLRSARKTA